MKKILILIIALFSLNSIVQDCKAQTLTNYVQQKQKELDERRRVEKAKYEKACKQGTLDLLQEYLKLYPKGKYVQDVKNRIFDFDLWSHAVSVNTIEGYNDYLKKSKFKSFSPQAQEAIQELNSVNEWNKLRKSTSINDINIFISKYPRSSKLKNAQNRIHELNAVDYYNNNQLSLAYNEFINAGGKYAIESSNRAIFEKCEEYHEYKQLSSFSKEDDLIKFLNRYPSSSYANEISNWIAKSKAKSLTMYSGEYSFNQALSYAKDDETKKFVESYVRNCKSSYSQYKRVQRRNRHNANGRLIQFGFEMMDLGFNPSSYEEYESDLDIVWYYNLGLSIKIGNYRDPVQFEIGAKPGLIGYTIWYDYEDESKSKFHLPLYAKLKVNLCNLGSKSKLYINATGYYNAIKEDFLENDFAIAGGLGVAWYHWDWSMYYKSDIKPEYDLDNDFIGTSLIYYF